MENLAPKRPYKNPVPIHLAAGRDSHFPGLLFPNKFLEIVLGKDLLSLEWSRISVGKLFAELNQKHHGIFCWEAPLGKLSGVQLQ